MPAVPEAGNVATRRPAETATGVAGAIAALIIAIFGISDPAIIAPLAVIIGFIPTAITWIVDLVVKTRQARSAAPAQS
jgi:hypothetical protein